MRRKYPDISYKRRTADIITATSEPWQLIRKDEREGFHRMTNRIISMSEELSREANYVQSMFFPDMIDLSEEWVMYYPTPVLTADELYFSGQPVSQYLTEAESADDFISYHIDALIPRQTVSGIVGGVESIAGANISQTYVLYSGYVYTLDLINRTVVTSGQIDFLEEVEHTVTFDRDHRGFRLTDDYIEDTVSVTNASGELVPFEVLTLDDLGGIWNPDFDANGDNLIGSYEKSILDGAYGKGMADYTPDEWARIAWADVNKDGKITETDYRAVMSAIPSARHDTTGIVTVPYSKIGKLTVSYTLTSPLTKGLFTAEEGYTEMMSETVLYDYASICTYDPYTQVYYGIITGSEGKELRAFKYDSELNTITGDVLIGMAFWSADCSVVDVDIAYGHLFLLVTDGTLYRILYGDIHAEFVEEIAQLANVEISDGFTPDRMTVTDDGYFLLSEGNRIEIFEPIRDRYYEINDVVYVNRLRVYTDSDGSAVTMVPSYVFNNMDSFAYGFGIERPWGCDNLTMRKLVMDFYNHPQGNDRRGAVYGLMREFGYENDTIIISGLAYTLPAELTTSGSITVNDYDMSVIYEDESIITLSGEIGIITISGGVQVIPDPSVSSLYDELLIHGEYRDGNGDTVELTQYVDIDMGIITPEIRISTLAEWTYLEEVGLTVDGVLTAEMVARIEEAEEANPFIYKNAVVNETLMDIMRLTEDPLLPTGFNPDILVSGLVSSGEVVELDI